MTRADRFRFFLVFFVIPALQRCISCFRRIFRNLSERLDRIAFAEAKHLRDHLE